MLQLYPNQTWEINNRIFSTSAYYWRVICIVIVTWWKVSYDLHWWPADSSCSFAPRHKQPTVSKTAFFKANKTLFFKRTKRFFESEPNRFFKANKTLFWKRTKPLLLKQTQSFFSKRTIRLFEGPPTPILPRVVAIVVGVSRCHASLLLHCVVVVVSVSRKRCCRHSAPSSRLVPSPRLLIRSAHECELPDRYRQFAVDHTVIKFWFSPRPHNYGIPPPPPHSNTSR